MCMHTMLYKCKRNIYKSTYKIKNMGPDAHSYGCTKQLLCIVTTKRTINLWLDGMSNGNGGKQNLPCGGLLRHTFLKTCIK